MDSDGSTGSDTGERQSIIIDMSMNTPVKDSKEISLDETMPFFTTSGFSENDSMWGGSGFGRESLTAEDKVKELETEISQLNARWFELERMPIFTQVAKKENYASSGPCFITKATSDLKNW